MTKKPTLNDLLAAVPSDRGCDATFDDVATYVELELAGKAAAARLPHVAAHLRACPACRLDHDGILAAARAED